MRAEDESRRRARPHEIRAETQRLEERGRRNIFEVMTEEEIARLWDVAPGLMRDVNRRRKD